MIRIKTGSIDGSHFFYMTHKQYKTIHGGPLKASWPQRLNIIESSMLWAVSPIIKKRNAQVLLMSKKGE